MKPGIFFPFFIFLFTLLICNTVYSQALEQLHSVDSIPKAGQEMPLGAISPPKDGQGVPSVASKALGHRYPQMAFEVDGYAVAPGNLQLEQVHIYVRHGERTPVGVRLANPPASIPEHWTMCRTARRFRTTLSNMLGVSSEKIPTTKELHHRVDETQYVRKLVEQIDGTTAEGVCLLGELTDLGRQSTFHFGHNLRKLYIDRLGFLPNTLPNEKIVYFRSTNMPRTTESLLEIIHGLYPADKRHPTVVPPLLIRNGKDENLIGNTYACKRLEILQLSFAKAAAEAYNHTLEHLDKKVSKYIDGNPMRIDGRPRASGILDTIRAAVAHGIKVPPEFEDKSVVDLIEKAVVNEWFAGCKVVSIVFNDQLNFQIDKTEEVRRLGMGRLLEDLSRKMQHKAVYGNQDPLKILVHSTHDTALAGLCSTLDVFDDRWPAFTASITFELYRKAGPPSQCSYPQAIFSRFATSPAFSQHYVRMRYQNKNMVLPVCAQTGNHLEGHPEFCTLAAFRDRVKELTPTDWDVECSPMGRT